MGALQAHTDAHGQVARGQIREGPKSTCGSYTKVSSAARGIRAASTQVSAPAYGK